LPAVLGRPNATIAKIIDEYRYVVVSRQPTS